MAFEKGKKPYPSDPRRQAVVNQRQQVAEYGAREDKDHKARQRSSIMGAKSNPLQTRTNAANGFQAAAARRLQKMNASTAPGQIKKRGRLGAK